ncbi:MAG: hypothetical protein CL933_03140 [Deltaproteobacteria bacterium]|nr:hypothetical protein [Deltaproteobacteria bacterium]
MPFSRDSCRAGTPDGGGSFRPPHSKALLTFCDQAGVRLECGVVIGMGRAVIRMIPTEYLNMRICWYMIWRMSSSVRFCIRGSFDPLFPDGRPMNANSIAFSLRPWE